MPPPLGFGQATAVKKLPGLFVPLTLLTVFVVALGLVYATQYVVDMLVAFIRNTVGRVPVIGGVLSAKADKLRRIISDYMSKLAGTCERRVAGYFRAIGQVFVEMATEFAAIAVALGALTWFVTKKLFPPRKQLQLDQAAKLPKKIPGTVKRIVIRETRVIRKTVTKVQRTVIKQGTVIIRTGLRALPRWVQALRRRVRTLERGHARQAKRLTGLERRWMPRRFDAAVNRSLGRLGVGWTRCSPVQRLGRQACQSGILDTLLTGLIPAMLLADVCLTAAAIRRAAELAAPALRAIVAVEGAAFHCTSFPKAPPLPVRYSQLPPSTHAVTL